MKPYHQSPWMRVSIATAAAKRRAEVLIEGYIGYDWEKEAKGKRQNLADALRAELKALAAMEADEIEVRINSPGGSVAHGIAIHDLLAGAKADVTTIVEGMTASAATVIAQAGKTRRMSANALYLVHRVSSYAFGNVNDLELGVKDLRAMDERLAGIYAKRSGRNAADILALMDRANGRGEWLSADQAKEAGLIDEALEPRDMAAAVDPGVLASLGLPPIPAAYAGRFANTSRAQHPEQTTPPVTDAAVVAAEPQQPKGVKHVKITAEQATALRKRFGDALVADAAIQDLEYADAVSLGADILANALNEIKADAVKVGTERDAAKAEVAALTTKLAAAEAKLSDPLKPSEKREPPVQAPEVKSVPEAHAELVKAGKSAAEAWTVIRTERPADYAAHFGMR